MERKTKKELLNDVLDLLRVGFTDYMKVYTLVCFVMTTFVAVESKMLPTLLLFTLKVFVICELVFLGIVIVASIISKILNKLK